MSRRNPFEELEELFERMSGQFDAGDWYRAGGQSIAVDLVDEGDHYELTADLPGYDREDINLTLTDGSLRIEAEREKESEVERDESPSSRYVRRERHRQTVSRSVRVPEPIEEEESSANYHNGVLTVILPKLKPAVDSTQIDIE